MQQLTEFIIHHWIWVSILALAIIALIVIEIRNPNRASGNSQLTAEQVVALVNHEKAVIIDIRTEEQFQNGHVINAISIPASRADTLLMHLKKYKQRSIILVCALGTQAPKLVAQLQQAGLKKIYILAGGMRAWKSASMPIIK